MLQTIMNIVLSGISIASCMATIYFSWRTYCDYKITHDISFKMQELSSPSIDEFIALVSYWDSFFEEFDRLDSAQEK